MGKRVLDVGNCDVDFSRFANLVRNHFQADVQQAHSLEAAIAELRQRDFQLVTVNRVFDRDRSDGMELLKAMKADARLSDIPVMLITNYSDHMSAAVAAGAIQGFGKAQLRESSTLEVLRPFLS